MNNVPNPYVTPEFNFEFHYFFMRKFWFAYLAKALVVFPGGFGTLDELTEILTLAQTRKLENKIVIVMYGSDFWREIINFDALVRHGMIAESDLDCLGSRTHRTMHSRITEGRAGALLSRAGAGPSKCARAGTRNRALENVLNKIARRSALIASGKPEWAHGER